MNMECPFCQMVNLRIVSERPSCYAVRDLFPVTEGHTLIIPRRHTASFRDLTEEEWRDIHILASEQSSALRSEDDNIRGFNFGINDGEVAGQTIFHVHIHLIPRRSGDVENPRGGVRHIIPGKGDYPSATP